MEAKPDEPTGARGESFFSTKNVTLVPDESTDIKLRVSTQRCLCRYRFEVEMVKADSVVKLEIGDAAGRPFTITGPAKSYSDQWIDGGLACQKSGVFRSEPDGTSDCKTEAQ